MIRLTPNFTLEELCATQHRTIDNRPPDGVLAALQHTAEGLELVRRALGGRVITVSSGYRSPALNKAVGGAANSAHMTGQAADFNCYGFGAPLAVCRAIAAAGIPFDQLIEEGTWVHISFDPRRRGEILTKRPGGGYAPGLAPP